MIIDVVGDDTHVTVSVQDSGIGIPTEDIPHLFQKFYRVDNSDTREIGGTGLGLYLCRRLAELMGGQILVQSEYKKGSTFSLELPRIDHTEAQRLMDASAAAKQLSDMQPAAIVPPEPPVLVAPPVPQAPPAQVQPPQPAVPQQVAPVAPAPVPEPAQPTKSVSQPVTPQAPNIPLSQLEQHPDAYVSQRPAMQIPVRDAEQPRQP